MTGGPLELLARARAGQPDALGELCNLYRNYLRMVVRTGLGPKLRELVELSDVVQETLVEVVRQFPQFTGQTEAALVGWLRRLVSQKLADLGRYHSRVKRAAGTQAVPLDAPLGGGAGLKNEDGAAAGSLLDVLALSQTSPSEAASKRELIVLLADALTSLPVDQAEAIWLYSAEGVSFDALGEHMGISRKAAKGKYARGLANLRRSLKGPPGGSLRYDGP